MVSPPPGVYLGPFGAPEEVLVNFLEFDQYDFLILYTDSWQWYLTTSDVGLVVEKCISWPKSGLFRANLGSK